MLNKYIDLGDGYKRLFSASSSSLAVDIMTCVNDALCLIHKSTYWKYITNQAFEIKITS